MSERAALLKDTFKKLKEPNQPMASASAPEHDLLPVYKQYLTNIRSGMPEKEANAKMIQSQAWKDYMAKKEQLAVGEAGVRNLSSGNETELRRKRDDERMRDDEMRTDMALTEALNKLAGMEPWSPIE